MATFPILFVYLLKGIGHIEKYFIKVSNAKNSNLIIFLQCGKLYALLLGPNVKTHVYKFRSCQTTAETLYSGFWYFEKKKLVKNV